MTYGKVTKVDQIGKNKKPADQKKLQEHTEEELIDSSKNFILSIFVEKHKYYAYTNLFQLKFKINLNLI